MEAFFYVMKKRIAIQGIAGSFHHLAVMHFEEAYELVPCLTFDELIRQVQEGGADEGVMALENSVAGGLMSNYQLLRDAGLFISGEVTLGIRQHLLAKEMGPAAELKEIHSHPVAIRQCRPYLDRLKIPVIDSADTALSARHVSQSNAPIAAIGSRLAAKTYHLHVIVENINEVASNYTRFVRLAREKTIQGQKHSIYLELPDAVGSLAHLLNTLSNAGANLQMVHSVPLPKASWHYGFFLDFLHDQILPLRQLLSGQLDALVELGTYEKGDTIWE